MSFATEHRHPGLTHAGHSPGGPSGMSPVWHYMQFRSNRVDRWVITRHRSTDKAAAFRWAWWAARDATQEYGDGAAWEPLPEWCSHGGIYGRTLAEVISAIEDGDDLL